MIFILYPYVYFQSVMLNYQEELLEIPYTIILKGVRHKNEMSQHVHFVHYLSLPYIFCPWILLLSFLFPASQ